ncbi:MAG TPA: TerC family protein [Myxococcota bacterium]|nr:TerC family protein [Myxococcota bacterium]HRY95198.1 TerC family protein [Myxococcota bacterium]HSA20511.1 TerC family protein [Myxococcota bacterium]
MFDVVHLELWAGFWAIIIALLALDLAVFNRHAHKVSIRAAAIWSAVWIGISLLFCGGVWWLLGAEPAMQFLAGYLVEKSLSVDNLFVFLVIFTYFGVEAKYQHRVLYWGVLGAIILRTLMIVAGAALVARFNWLLYIFGAFLIYTGVKLAVSKGEAVDPGKNLAVRVARKLFSVTPQFHGEHFFVKLDGKRLATPMFVVLVTVELSDVMFAVDSIPAIFGITQDAFILLTSNIFAIMGLRALYFLLAGIMDRFHYLKLGLSVVLAFIGVKMLIAEWVHIPTPVSLGIVFGILTGAVLISFLRKPPHLEPVPGKDGEPPATSDGGGAD